MLALSSYVCIRPCQYKIVTWVCSKRLSVPHLPRTLVLIVEIYCLHSHNTTQLAPGTHASQWLPSTQQSRPLRRSPPLGQLTPMTPTEHLKLQEHLRLLSPRIRIKSQKLRPAMSILKGILTLPRVYQGLLTEQQ